MNESQAVSSVRYPSLHVSSHTPNGFPSPQTPLTRQPWSPPAQAPTRVPISLPKHFLLGSLFERVQRSICGYLGAPASNIASSPACRLSHSHLHLQSGVVPPSAIPGGGFKRSKWILYPLERSSFLLYTCCPDCLHFFQDEWQRKRTNLLKRSLEYGFSDCR